MNNTTKKSLIIGGAGFIGSRLSERLLESGDKVVIIDNFSTNAIGKNKNSIKSYKINIENLNKVRHIFKKEKPDFVYHLAGAINLRRQVNDPLFVSSLDVLGRTKIILDCCIDNKVKKLLFVSSGGAIYSNPKSIYALANLIIEKYIELYGLNYTILRLSNVYGPRQWRSGIIPQIVINLLGNKRPVISGNGKQTRDFIYIDDAVSACIVAIKHGKRQIYDIGSGKDISLNAVFNIVKKMLNSKIKPKYQDLIKEKLQKNALNIQDAKKELQWDPEINIENGLSRTIESFKNEKS